MIKYLIKNRHFQRMLLYIRRKRISPTLIVGTAIFLMFFFTGILGQYIAPYDSEEMHYEHLKELPSKAFLLGTDRFGRDVLSRVIIGTRTTLVIGAASVGLALLFGIIVGTVSAFLGGWVDNLMMRANDIFISFPTLIFAIFVIGVLGPSIINGVIAIGIVYAPRVARVVRSAALNIISLEYIDAAKVRGEASSDIIFREILPNIWPTIIVEGSIRLGYAILLSVSMGYIGLGPPPPTPDWGLMASSERGYMFQNPWPVFGPCIAIVIAVIGINIFGEGVKDLLLAKGFRKREALQL